MTNMSDNHEISTCMNLIQIINLPGVNLIRNLKDVNTFLNDINRKGVIYTFMRNIVLKNLTNIVIHVVR